MGLYQCNNKCICTTARRWNKLDIWIAFYSYMSIACGYGKCVFSVFRNRTIQHRRTCISTHNMHVRKTLHKMYCYTHYQRTVCIVLNDHWCTSKRLTQRPQTTQGVMNFEEHKWQWGQIQKTNTSQHVHTGQSYIVITHYIGSVFSWKARRIYNNLWSVIIHHPKRMLCMVVLLLYVSKRDTTHRDSRLRT